MLRTHVQKNEYMRIYIYLFIYFWDISLIPAFVFGDGGSVSVVTLLFFSS